MAAVITALTVGLGLALSAQAQEPTLPLDTTGRQQQALLGTVRPLPDPGAPELGLVFFGDQGTGRGAQLQVARAVHEHCLDHRCDLVALLGDNINPHGARSAEDPQWQRKFELPYRELDLPFLAALGNHDRQLGTQAQLDYSQRSERWQMPSRYYETTNGPVQIFVLDTGDFDGVQRRWLRRGLRHSSATWKLVYGHHPYLSYGQHGSDPALQRKLRPVRRHADLYLAGHDHDQQVLQDPRGPLLVVMGSGGSPLREVAEGPETLYAASSHGFGWLLLSQDHGRLEVLDAQGRLRFELDLDPTPPGCTGPGCPPSAR